MGIMGIGKKGNKGRPAPLREHKAINEEYQGEAFFAGHKARLLVEAEDKIKRLEREIETHVLNMRRLMVELQNTPPPKADPAPEATQLAPGLQAVTA